MPRTIRVFWTGPALNVTAAADLPDDVREERCRPRRRWDGIMDWSAFHFRHDARINIGVARVSVRAGKLFWQFHGKRKLSYLSQRECWLLAKILSARSTGGSRV